MKQITLSLMILALAAACAPKQAAVDFGNGVKVRSNSKSTYASPAGDWAVTLATADGRLLGYFIVGDDGFTERFVLEDILTPDPNFPARAEFSLSGELVVSGYRDDDGSRAVIIIDESGHRVYAYDT